MIISRVNFLRSRNKLDEALAEAIQGAEKLSGKDKAEVLFLAADLMVQKYQETREKSHATQALQIIQQLINENLATDGRPQGMAAIVFEIDQQYDIAIKYLREAEKLAAGDIQNAGTYNYRIVSMTQKSAGYLKVISAADEYLAKYPNHDRRQEVEQWKQEAETSLELQRQLRQ